MKKTRRSFFSGSWYPDTAERVTRQLEKWDRELGQAEQDSVSAIVPHAGWFFSGRLAYDSIRRLRNDVDIILILGGHLSGDSPYLIWSADSCNTPFGELKIQKQMEIELKQSLNIIVDDSPDNTIEVQLPMVHYCFGSKPIMPIRVPAGDDALLLAGIVKEIAERNQWQIAVIGSTDLTHYGPNYGFIPTDSIQNPGDWVETSDRRILEAMTSVDGKQILRLARDHYSACSAGAAVGAAAWGRIQGADRGRLLHYETSLSKHNDSSFVGYGSIIYSV